MHPFHPFLFLIFSGVRERVHWEQMRKYPESASGRLAQVISKNHQKPGTAQIYKMESFPTKALHHRYLQGLGYDCENILYNIQ